MTEVTYQALIKVTELRVTPRASLSVDLSGRLTLCLQLELIVPEGEGKN